MECVYEFEVDSLMYLEVLFMALSNKLDSACSESEANRQVFNLFLKDLETF